MKTSSKKNLYLHVKGSHRVRFSHAAETGIIIALFLISIFLIIYIYGKIFSPVYLISDNQPSFEGVNGYGTVVYHPEKDALKQLKEQKEKLQNEGKDTKDLDKLISSVSCSFDKQDNLENGETITYACSYDQAAAMKAGFSLRHLHRSFTVTNLKRIQTIDPFDYISISIDNNRPILSVSNELSPLSFDYQYTFLDDANVFIKLLYDPEVIARAGWKFSRDIKNIHLDTDPLILDQNTIQHLSEANKEEVNKAAADLSLPDSIPSIKEALPDSSRILSSPSIERWYINTDGKLAIVYEVNTNDDTGLHTWEITVSYNITASLSSKRNWSLCLTDSSIEIISKQEGTYEPKAVK